MNDHHDIGKLKAKGDIGFFIGYSENGQGYQVYNRTRKVMEIMNVKFDELSTMAYELQSLDHSLQQMASMTHSLEPALNHQTSRRIRLGLVLNQSSPTITLEKPSKKDLDNLTIEHQAHTPTNSSTNPSNIESTLGTADEPGQQEDVTKNVNDAVLDDNIFVNPFGTLSMKSIESSSCLFDPSNMYTFYQRYHARPTEKHLKEMLTTQVTDISRMDTNEAKKDKTEHEIGRA
ncbi:hypothetical protein Tco_0216756 [Tanacetum coccineum]